jgi:hypothetical protein
MPMNYEELNEASSFMGHFAEIYQIELARTENRGFFSVIIVYYKQHTRYASCRFAG